MIEQSSFSKLVGSTLGFYTLEQVLDQNILGATFTAHSTTANTTYRVRVLRLSSTMTPETRIVFFGHFQQQARELAELLTEGQEPKQPNLLPLLDYGNAQSLPYLVSPYSPAQSLTALLTTQGPMDAQTVSRYLDQIATALEYAHQHAVLHRDLTTDVVFVRDNGQLVIADLGVMRMLETSRKEAQQALLYGNGPSAAPAPEQLLGQPVHTYTDVYAMGALLYRLLTGHRVFGGSSRENMVEQHVHAPVPSVAKWRQMNIGARDITAELDKLLASALAKDPQQRLQHPAELANQYAQLVGFYPGRQAVGAALAPTVPMTPAATPAASLPMTAPAAPPKSTAPKAASRPPVAARSRSAQMSDARRRTLLLVGAGAATIVVVGGFGFLIEHLLNNSGTAATSSGSAQAAPTSQPAQQPTQKPAGTVIAQASAVPLNTAKTFTLPGSTSANPDILVHLKNGQFVAFDSTCTHQGCAVSYKPQDQLLECPCHGATFDPARQGAVVQGPAQTALAAVQITVNSDGSITAG